MRERATIPILGIDERPTKARQVPGLASSLIGVRPDGFTDNPQWVPIAELNELKNASEVVFNHSEEETLLRVFWHVRSRAGKHGNSNGSLRRLICLFNDGTVEIVDPDLSPGFATVASYSVTSSDSGSWDMDFTQLYDAGFVSVTKGGIPQESLIIEDDLIIKFSFPELPTLRTFSAPSDELYKYSSIKDESYGLGVGYFSQVFVQYAYRLADGTLVKHSPPEVVTLNIIRDPSDNDELSDDTLYFTAYLKTYFEGYDSLSVPSNFEYWKDKIKGVTVLVSEVFRLSAERHTKEELKQSTWYELYSFDYIDHTDVELEDRILTSVTKDSNFSSLPVADVDDNTHHNYAFSSLFTYNSRVVTGDEVVDFGLPWFSKACSHNRFVYVHKHPTSGRYMLFYYGDDDLHGRFFSTSNLVGVTIETKSTGQFLTNRQFGYVQVLDSNGTFKLTFSDYFSMDLSIPTLSTYNENVLPNTYKNADTAPGTRNILAVVSIETEKGEYQRRSEKFAIFVGVDDDEINWEPEGGLISYPDLRATNIQLFVEDETDVFLFIKNISLISSKRMNIAFSPQEEILWDDSTLSMDESPSGLTVNAVNEHTPNKLKVSGVNTLFSFDSSLVYAVGRASERITAFAVNSLEVSQGQFGQYPLFVFQSNSIWALEQSQSVDVVFARISPVDTSIGVDSVHKLVNIGRLIAFVSESGIYVLGGSLPELISDPVSSIIPNITVLGYKKYTDDQELLVALDSGKVFHYSTKFKRWYASSQDIRHFFNDNSRLYALENGADKILDFQSPDLTAEVDVTIQLDHIHFGYPKYLKRFLFFYVRGELNDTTANKLQVLAQFEGKTFTSVSSSIGSKKIRPKWKSVYEVALSITGKLVPDTHYLEEVSTEFDMRYPRKLKST